MLFLNLLVDFYSGLSGNSFFFFWVIVFIIILLIGLIGLLIIKNNKLERLLKKLNNMVEEDSNLDNLNDNGDESLEYYKLSEEDNEDKELYQKNVLRDYSNITSPVNIPSSKNYISIERDSNVSPLEEMEDLDIKSDKISETQNIMSKLENASKPNSVNLTDYEKKLEDEAIISYNELQKVKDKIYDTEESEETDEYIEQLRSLDIDVK